MCQRGALQHAADGRRGDARPARGEESPDRKEDPGHIADSAGTQSADQRTDRAQGSHGYQGSKDQCAAAQGQHQHEVERLYKTKTNNTTFHTHTIQIENLEDLLKEKDNQVDMARARLSAMQAHHSSSEGALTSLEEAIGDKEKQMAQLREQRDRAEHEKQEERDLHEREVTDYKMKLRAAESDVEKLQTRLERAVNERERLEIKLEASQSELGKSKAELEKATCEMGRSSADWESTKQRIARLELENERLKHDLERSQVLVHYNQFPQGSQIVLSFSRLILSRDIIININIYIIYITIYLNTICMRSSVCSVHISL